ncbi:hypothetical protein SAMN04487884_10242 [Butyrivibrio fibrisolvens]|uniref:Uncharacterized protein n=1 Tax=Butyrivibrio fibrisolvens TaxID=831 RepID=A0A1H9LEF7_BUTFI|nr:hypothetical protein [Butyrivibrio fibrisolvens]SER09738.1 hypothetical protein SAMN04487884_10242 [Butyrivibrio fibrisolvens]
MKRRSLLIVSVLTLSVYMTFASGCVHKDPDIGSEAIAINPDGSPKDVSDAAGNASTLEEPLQDPYEYLDPALEILSWKCVNDVAAGKAIEYIDKAIEIDDGLTDAYKARGSAYLCLGDSIEHFDSAEADFIKLQELDPDNPDGYLGQAEVLIRKGHKDEAIELLNKAKDLLKSANQNGAGAATGSGSSSEGETGQGASSEGEATETGLGTGSDGNASETGSDSSSEGNVAETGSGTGDGGNASETGSESGGDGNIAGNSSETIDEGNTSETGSDSEVSGESDEADNSEYAANKAARYNSGIAQIFMTSEDDIQRRIDELMSDTYSDSTGRVRYKTVYGQDGAVASALFYACYQYGEYEPDIIVSYNAEGTMVACAFNFYEGTKQYVYGMYTSSDTWNVCIPMWSEDGTMTGIETIYGGSVIAYDMYLYDAEGNMAGCEQYNSSKNLENTVYFDGYSAESVEGGGEGVVGTAVYTIEDVYALVEQFWE